VLLALLALVVIGTSWWFARWEVRRRGDADHFPLAQEQCHLVGQLCGLDNGD
jgi:hypothetical protein